MSGMGGSPLLEAMAWGAVLIGSATAPVREVIRDGDNGLPVDCFDGDGLAERIAAGLADPAAHRPLGEAARQDMVTRNDLTTVCLPQQLALVDQVAQIGHDQIGPGQIGVKSMGSPDCKRPVPLDRLAINH